MKALSISSFMSWLYALWRSFQREERLALASCGALLLLCAGMQHARPAASQSPVLVDAPATAGKLHHTGSASSGGQNTLRIHVAGAVNRPGVQSLPAGARIADAVRAAGGPVGEADVQVLNLAAHLQDGAQIVVPRKGQTERVVAPPSAIDVSSATVQPAGRGSRQQKLPARAINLNTATAEELEALPGIGPSIAQRIVQHRAEKGRFQSLQDVDEVKGIGAKKLEQLQPYVIF
jgi:competence protein ComEA